MQPDETEIDLSAVESLPTGAASDPIKPKRQRAERSDKGVPRGPRGGSTQSANQGSRAARRGGRIWIREQVGTLVGLSNLGLVFLSPEDALSTEDYRHPVTGTTVRNESDLLTDALTAEALASDRIQKWLLVAAGVSPHVLMVQAIVTIAIPRLQRRGIIPKAPELTPEQEAALRESFKQASSVAEQNGYSTYSPDATVSMETGGTP
jgi:hypothetical protein